MKWSAFLLTIVVLAIPGKARAQTFSGDFSVSSGAIYQTAGTDQANAVAVDTISAGGPFIYVTGASGGVGATVKLSSAGVALSSAPFGILSSATAQGVAVDPSGNVWVVGYSEVGPARWLVQKHAPDLTVIATSSAGPTHLDTEVARAIVFDASGNAYVAGYSSNIATGMDFTIVKYSPSLVMLSSASLPVAGIEQAMAIALDASGNPILAGGRSPNDYLTVKYDSSLVLLSSAVYDSGAGSDYAYGVAADPSGNIYVTGYADAGGANYAFRTVKYNSSLAQTAVASFNTPAYDAGFGALFVGTNTLVVVGSSMGGATEDMIILEYDASLTQISSRSFDAGMTDRAQGVAKGTGTYVYVTGYSHSPAAHYRTIRMNAAASGGGAAAAPPAAPSAFAGTAQSTASVLWSWTDNSSDETGFRIMAGATNVSGNLAANATAWLQAGLAVNTSSGALFVQAFNSTGTADSGSLARYSLAAVPTGLASSSVFRTSATISWSGSATAYQLERSTGGGFTTVHSSAAATYGDTSLAVAATYYYRVLGYNGDSVATAYASTITVVTLPAVIVSSPAAPSAFAGAAQSTASVLWSWTDAAANEDGYRVLSGTISLSGNLAAGTTVWLQTGLTANTSYGPYAAQAFNGGGTANSGTASRTTLAAAPSALAAAVHLTSAAVSWSAGGNPAGTTFELERSSGAGYGLQLSGSATSYLDAALATATTYYYRVRALNGEAVATAYASTLAVVTYPAPPVPGADGTPAGTVLGTSSVSWTWALASGATSHNLFRASDGTFLASSASAPYAQAALSPNTAYGLRVAGVNLGGMGPLSAAATVYTLAAAPSGTGTAVTSTTVIASWGLNGNPPSTVAEFQRSTDAVVYATAAVSASTSYADADLLGCTTYYYRVRNLNGVGLPTAYASFQGVTANTVPGPPAGLNASANAGGTVSLAWSLSPTEGVTGYRLYWDAGSGTVSYGAPIAVLGSTATAFTTAVLTSSASYTFALRAAHRCGVIETTGASAMSGAAVAPPAVRAAIKEPDSGRRINGNSVTILAELTAGTPSDVQQIVFQYKLAASTAWAEVAEVYLDNPNPDYSFPYFTHADVNGLAAGSYDLRALAYDRNGVPDSAPPAVRVVVDHISPDISESVTAGGDVKKDQVVSNTVTSVVETAGSSASDPAVRVTIPPGAVSNTTATVSVIANPTITTAAPAGQSMVGSAIKIDLSNGQSALNGTAAISLTYPDTVRFPSLLQIYYLNEATGQWSRDFASTVDTASRTVSGNTPHFSTFALLLGSAFAPNLDSVQVYPVPFKPNGANANEGRPFSQGDPNSGIIFANLAMGSEIRIYTLTGRLVSSLDNAPISGTLRWDARNQDGRDVASGAYFAVIKAGGGKPVVKKLVIIR